MVRFVQDSIAYAACSIGEKLDSPAIVTFTSTGGAAARIAKNRPPLAILALTPNIQTRNQLALSWGLETYLVDPVTHTDEYAVQVDQYLLADGKCTEGDLVVIVAGSPPGTPGSTNALRVHRIGDAKNAVVPGYRRD